jgi:ribosomal protein S11
VIRRYLLPIAAAAAIVVIVCAIAGVLVLAGTRHQSSTSLPVAVTATTTQQASRVSTATQLVKAIRVFANAYGRYLDGDPATVLGRAGSVTSAAQAKQAGQIPAAFRDGRLTVTDLSTLESTCCSASVTVVLANREQSYPFAEQLLLERHGWVVDQITPADLSIDRGLRTVPHVSPTAAGAAAAREFALAYVDYRAGVSSTRPVMTAAAAQQVKSGTDSLAGQQLHKAAARLVSIRFGPPTGREFAATAVVQVAGARQRFSFLMVKTSTGWACAQFL